ncbi:LPS export ABC transporter periplasmic protein LptC [Cognatilysobacter terrigena]|uniref:LPS export ABC transporter periplasmic protein LptC n=1 Tax=Cognatilysobacter terrigena TaxID=2488749 RepID=UPI00105BC1BE|nr:LPS export ABC transporter periplasmic protein LptC [Lysobacter terrigena]
MNWRLVLGIVLTAAAIAIGASLWRQNAMDLPLEAGRSDYTLHDFELVSLDAQGNESFTLRAPKLTRDPDVRTLSVTTPVFIIPPRAGSADTPWTVDSKTAWVSAKGDEIRLRGDVHALSTKSGGQPVRMDTQELDVFPNANRATSKVAVSVKQPGLILNGHGMDAKLDDRVVQLRNFKARYEKSP